MSRQWMTLMAILLVYIPVAIDATVLRGRADLSVALGGNGNELLWIIDIYSLVMAGMVLPMGALGDKIGFKRLLLLGSAIFGIASLCAALSPTYDADCLTRFAGGGGGDDRPGDAGRDPQHLCRGQSAQYGAGAVGSGRLRRRGLRPAGGRYPAGAFLLGSVF